METHYRQERLTRWFLPSLILHLLILFAFFMFEKGYLPPTKDASIIFENPTYQHAQPLAQKPLPLPPDDEEVLFALNLPKTTNFGATSLVSDETTLAGDPAAQDTTTQEAPADDEPAEQPEPKSEIPENSTPNFAQPMIEESPSLSDEHRAIEQPVVEEKTEAPPKRQVKNFWGQAKKSSSPISQKMSLTRLAEGFLDYTKETQGTAVNINSRDLNLQPILQKIGWFLQNSFRAHNKPISLHQDVRTNTTLHLEIDADGALLNCYLSPQTNVAALDRNLLRIAQGAAPFPPIPQRVLRNKKTFSVKIPIAIDAHQGTHEYYFMFRS
jgi:outer membrane biosynthesis protein TonB